MDNPRVFDQKHYELLNQARRSVVLRLLADLQQDAQISSAIDVGCGTGYFSQVLQSQGLRVTAVDGRSENVEEAQRRHPGVSFRTMDVQSAELLSLGKFDLVFCFGLLYHLENPLQAIRNLAAMTAEVLLSESVIFPGDEPGMVLIDEYHLDDQGLRYIAFYPTEPCLIKMFYRAGFENVYGISERPDHRDYHDGTGNRRIRTVLVASRRPFRSRLLQRLEEPSSAVIPWDGSIPMKPLPTVQKLKQFAAKPFSEKVTTIRRIINKQ